MEKYYTAAINAVNLLGAQRTRRLIEFFKGAEKVWRAEPAQLEQAGLSAKVMDSFLDFRQKHPDAPEKLVEFCAAARVKLCAITDKDYPPLLREIDSPPPVFYYRGNLQSAAERLAIVGTRHNTGYGERAAHEISSELAEAGFTIVSGAATGIDTFAHRGALKFGRTVAVLGYGITQVPRDKKILLDKIAENGLVMTEFAPSIKPHAGTFPTRNRIIAGLSRGVIVIEAGKKSGALITSTYAGNFGRDVFAVPGNVFYEKSYGCNELIRDGAILVKNARDILEFYNIDAEKISSKAEPAALDPAEEKILNLIPAGDFITLDEILAEIDDLAPEEIAQIVLNLELKNFIVESGGRYARA